MNQAPTDEPLIPRLLASNALRANLSKHMDLNKMADSKASMILTASSLIITITLTQYEQLHLSTVLLLAGSGLLAVVMCLQSLSVLIKMDDLVGYFGKGNIVTDQKQLIIPVLGDVLFADID